MTLNGSRKLVARDPKAPPAAEIWAELAPHASSEADAPLLFGVYDGKLGLRLNDGGKTSPLTIDFEQGPLADRARRAGPKSEVVVRACGVTRKLAPRVLDASGGLGRDALILAACGARVTLLERDPFLAAMLKEALANLASSRPERGSVSGAEGTLKISLIHADVRSLSLEELASFDTIYFDPMFPERTKAAAVKLDMQILQALHGAPTQEEDDAEAVLAHLLAGNVHRTVVKRPIKAPELAALSRPILRMRSDAMRFDIWLKF